MLGYAPEELEGKHVETMLTVAGRLFFQTHLYPLVRLHGRADELFVLLRRKDGSDAGALLNAVRRSDGPGAITDCVLMEVRERRKFEDALVRAKQAAEAATAALEERSRALREANEALEEQAVELELQQQQVEEQSAELLQRSQEIRRVNEVL